MTEKRIFLVTAETTIDQYAYIVAESEEEALITAETIDHESWRNDVSPHHYIHSTVEEVAGFDDESLPKKKYCVTAELMSYGNVVVEAISPYHAIEIAEGISRSHFKSEDIVYTTVKRAEEDATASDDELLPKEVYADSL